MLASSTIAAWRSPSPIYRQFFTAAETRMLDASPLESALSEIGLLRVLLMRLLAAARRLRRLSIEQHLSMLSAVSATGMVMASLVRFHHKYLPPSDSLLEALADMDPDDL